MSKLERLFYYPLGRRFYAPAMLQPQIDASRADLIVRTRDGRVFDYGLDPNPVVEKEIDFRLIRPVSEVVGLFAISNLAGLIAVRYHNSLIPLEASKDSLFANYAIKAAAHACVGAISAIQAGLKIGDMLRDRKIIY